MDTIGLPSETKRPLMQALQSNLDQKLLAMVSAGSAKAVELLLNLGANSYIKTENTQKTILRVAAENGHLEVLRVLFSKIKLTSEDARALVDAAEKGHSHVVDYLLTKNVDVNVKNEEGFTALMVAAQNKQQAVFEKLVRHVDLRVDERDEKGMSALFFAVQQNDLSMVKILVYEKHADVNLFTKSQLITPLMIAAEQGNVEIAKALFGPQGRTKLNLNAVSKTFMTPLAFAAQSGHAEMVAYLLSKGAWTELRDERCPKPIELARKGATTTFNNPAAEEINQAYRRIIAMFSSSKKRSLMLDSSTNLPCSSTYLPAKTAYTKNQSDEPDSICVHMKQLTIIEPPRNCS